MRHVIPIANVGEFQPVKSSKPFQNGLHVGQRLAGVEHIAQRVDNGHARPFGQSLNR
jgi:hypothetical protein